MKSALNLVALALLAVGLEVNAQPENPKSAVSGVVLNPDGTRAGGATVVMVTGKPWHGIAWFAESTQGKPDPRGEGLIVAQTDQQGRFVFQNPARPNSVFMLAESGCAWRSVPVLATNPIATLEPWIVLSKDSERTPAEELVRYLSHNFNEINEWLYSVRDEASIPEQYRKRGAFERGPLDAPNVYARRALIAQGTNAWPTIPLLVDTLFNTNRGARMGQSEAVQVLASIRADASPAWPLVKQRLANRSEPVEAIAWFLDHKLGWPMDQVEPQAQRFALLALAAIGPAAGASSAAVFPRILPLINSNSNEIQMLAWEAIGAVGSGSSNAVPVLERMLKDSTEYPNLRMSAGVALAQIQPSNTNVLRVFREGLRDERAIMRVFSAEGLNRLGISPDEYLPAITNTLDHKLVTVRCTALKTLAKLGSRARATMPQIEKLTTDENEKVRTAASEALKSVAN